MGELKLSKISPKDQILELRRALHFTQEALARDMQIGLRTVARWEAGGGASFMAWVRLRGYADLRGVSMAWPWSLPKKGAK